MTSTRTCAQCGEEFFAPVRPGRTPRYCSDRCRAAFHRASIPEAMRLQNRWACYDHPEKRPRRADGRPASSTDPLTWSTYAQVRPFIHEGFMLGGGIGCVDIDHCLIKGTTLLHPAIEDRIAPLMATTYIEVSPSETGLHTFGLMNEDRGWRKSLDDGVTVELYSRERFMTVTGHRFEGCTTSKLGHTRRHFHDLAPVLG